MPRRVRDGGAAQASAADSVPDEGQAAEYRELCEAHASLTAYIEREAPEMRARGEHDALDELEKIAGAMLDRIFELYAQGAHLGSAGGAHDRRR